MAIKRLKSTKANGKKELSSFADIESKMNKISDADTKAAVSELCRIVKALL